MCIFKLIYITCNKTLYQLECLWCALKLNAQDCLFPCWVVVINWLFNSFYFAKFLLFLGWQCFRYLFLQSKRKICRKSKFLVQNFSLPFKMHWRVLFYFVSSFLGCVRVGRGIAGALLYSRNEAIIITEFLRRYFGDAYSKPRSRGKTKPFTVRTSLPSYSTVPCTPIAPYVHHTAHSYPDATPQHPQFTRIIISLDR